jgi:hypothetical protein
MLALVGSVMLSSGVSAEATPPAGAGVPRPVARPASERIPASDPGTGTTPPIPVILRRPALQYPNYALFVDPDPEVVVKEFTLFYNTIPDSTRLPGGARGLFHIVYQRSGGPQAAETLFGHAWSTDLRNWAVDTAAFSVDTTSWNSAHVWSPCLIRHGEKDYLFYTGVDSMGDQRIGYASTDRLDTTDTVWDPRRVMVWEAADTRWAVPRPWTYGYTTQFRDPFVMDDPDLPGRLLLFYTAHDSTDFAAGRGGLAVGIARSEPETVDAWEDLGRLRSTLPRTTQVGQLEGPHVLTVPGSHSGLRLLFSNGGTPPDETGTTTIRFEALVPGASVSDTSFKSWGAPTVLRDYLSGDPTVFGWSGSEHLSVGDADFLAGFTAWGPRYQGIAIARMHWQGDGFTLGGYVFTAVNEYRSDARGVVLRVATGPPPTRRVRFAIDSPRELDARLEVFDAMGRRLKSLLAGALPKGSSSVAWDLTTTDGASVPSGVYFARLSFAGGVRAVRLAVVR